ncbi:MAG TPA: isoprenylcysteine carboxylmethyltransferase family protein [Lacunisphaera sp.]|nr:isoprenylcysteine carboxylmethyltransferase family protein [Lacunisphaera sp.]
MSQIHAKPIHVVPAARRDDASTAPENRTFHPLSHRLGVLAFGVVSYAIFFATFCYAVGFVGNFVVPKSIDSARSAPFGVALLVNCGLLGLFALQHSVMARPFFKRWLIRYIPEAAERSTYTLFSSLALLALFAGWQPMGGVIWQMQSLPGRALLAGGFTFGWLLVLGSTFLINHFDLFGLRQVWLQFQNRRYVPLAFKTPGLYQHVRHPLYVGWFFAFWCTPTMTAAHFLFAVMTTGYILVAIQLEEHDLQAVHPEYADYKRRTPMLVPRLGGTAVPAGTRD